MAETQDLNIYQKLAKIRKQVEVMQKDKAGYGYKYVSENELLAKISTFMDKYSLSLIPSITEASSNVKPYSYKKTKSTKQGEIYEENVNEVLVNADMIFTWVNNEKPEERIEIPWILVGHQTDGSQSFGSGLTYSMRYFLLKFFNVATPDEDPDKWRSKQKAASVAEDKMVAEEIINSVDREIKTFLTKNPEKSDEVKKFVAKYVKGGNYFTISESLLASSLLSDFLKTFNIKE